MSSRSAPSQRTRGPGTRSGSTSGAQFVGLAEFRRELRKLEDPRMWSRELAKVHRTLAKQAAEWSRSEANAMGGVQKHFSDAIRGYGSAAAARIGIAKPEAYAAFWGAKQNRTGWNRGGSVPNIKDDWVGNAWDVARAGQGPYAINDALAEHMDDIVRLYGDAIDDLASRAFPDP